VPFTTENLQGTPISSTGHSGRNTIRLGTPLARKPSFPEFPDFIAGLDLLFQAEPVNLSQVSEEIRAYPDLEILIIRLGESLSLPLETPPCTIEEATVALGTDRLRVLMHALSLIEERAGHLAVAGIHLEESAHEICLEVTSEASGIKPTRFAEAQNLETLYLAGFLHWLGLDLQAGLANCVSWPFSRSAMGLAGANSLTEVFMRDFMILIPFLEPNLNKQVQTRRSSLEDKAHK